MGQEIRVVTPTANSEADTFPFPVIRTPTRGELWRQHLWSDVCFHNNITLNLAWPLALYPKPWVVAHHVWITDSRSQPTWRERMKYLALKRAANLAVSQVVADTLPVPCEIVGNPYDDEVFFEDAGVVKTGDVIYSGRLVSDKGVDLILKALRELKTSGMRPRLTIVGDGPERVPLQKMAEEFGIAEQITFAGTKTPRELAGLLRSHRVQVIPSRWQEPFGLVALEGLACGCRVIIAESGGLMEATGGCAASFRIGEVQELATRIKESLNASGPAPQESSIRAHLSRFTKGEVSRKYLAALTRALE